MIPGIDRKNVLILMLPLPPLAEQKRIVAKIEELLPYIDRYEEAWSKLEDFNTRFPVDMQKSLLQYAIQGKLVEQRGEEGTGEELYQQIQREKEKLIKEGKIKKGKKLPEITEDEIPFDIPESWKWVRLVELGIFSSGKTPTMGVSEFWEDGTIQWFTSKDMKKKYLSDSEMQITELAAKDMAHYDAGTLLMVVRSGILKRMLPVCILTKRSTINQDIKAYRLFLPEMCEYIFNMLKGLETRILKNYRKQVTTVDSLKFDEFSKEMLVPLPPLAEQKRIVAKLEEMLPLCEKLK
jgi:type I restriction enzyme S subunit